MVYLEEDGLTLKELELKKRTIICLQERFNKEVEDKLELIDGFIIQKKEIKNGRNNSS